MPKIKNYVQINDTAVPISETGRYLDWNAVSGGEAPPLTSPYGPLHFQIGNSEKRITLDFAELPNSAFVVEIEDPEKILRSGYLYNMLDRREVLAEVWRMTESALTDLDYWGIKHDVEEHGADAWYFFRAVCAAVGRRPYSEMADWQLRTQDTL